jgi:spermidine/putrescine transport system substrate-binding protein
MRRLDRRDFLKGSAALGGAVILSGCGSSSGIKADTGGGASSVAPVTYGGDVSSEPNKLVISEWPGYEAGGTKAQTYGLLAGKSYVKKYGASSLKYADYGNDDKTLNAMKAGQKFDMIHPCVGYVHDYVNAGVVQPWDTSLLPSFGNLFPEMIERGKVNGQQYWIPWDWGFSSILYRKDKIDAADATGWDLFWNDKYSGKISMWDGGSTPVEIAGLVMDPPAKEPYHMTSDELDRAKDLLIQQKPLNKFYWTSEYGNMQPAFKSGDIWVTYSWPNDYKDMAAALGEDKVEFMQEPTQGILAWVCGFMLGKDTASPIHAHEYVESFIAHDAAVDLTNLFAYGSSDSTVQVSEIKDQALAKKLKIGDPAALEPPTHLEQWIPNRADYQRVWAEVKAS